MPTAQQWLLFLGSALVFSVLPGPGMLYVLARSLRGGRSEGLRSVFGNTLGATLHAVAAALGLSAILAASAQAFFVVKLVGAAYLFLLGVRTLLQRPALDSPALAGSGPAPVSGGAFAQGVLSEVLNPKTAVYFLAILPHFVDTGSGSATLGLLVLGLVAVSVATGADVLVALAAGVIGERLARRPRLRTGQRWFSGCTLVGLGGLLAVSESS